MEDIGFPKKDARFIILKKNVPGLLIDENEGKIMENMPLGW